MSNFAILRTEKIKSLRELKFRSDHNARKSKQGLEHTDPDRPASLLLGSDDAVATWHEKAAAVGFDTSKTRKDGVVALEWLATASKEWWDTADAEQRAEWQSQSLAFIAEKAGGLDNVLSAHLHEDEETPHLQVLTTPLIEKEVKQRGRRKERTEAQTRTVWTLSAKDIIGGHRDRLVQLQTDYAERVASVGLRRGIPRKETGVRNMAPAKWRAAQALELDAQKAATTTAQAAQVAAVTNQREAAETLEISKAEALKITTTADERAQALNLGFEAVDTGELVYEPATEKAGEKLKTKRKERGSILPNTPDSVTRFSAAIRPYYDGLVRYAKRLAHLTQREAQVSTKTEQIAEREAQVSTRSEELDQREAQVSLDIETVAQVREEADLDKSAKVEELRNRLPIQDDKTRLRDKMIDDALTKQHKRTRNISR
jgi:hypothetical protein